MASIDENFKGDDFLLMEEAFDELEILLNSIQIQFQFITARNSTIILQDQSIKFFQKTKSITQYISNFNVNQKNFLVNIMNNIVRLYQSMKAQFNPLSRSNIKFNNVNQIYQTYLFPSFIIIKRLINPNDQRILAKPTTLLNPSQNTVLPSSSRTTTPRPFGIYPTTPPSTPSPPDSPPTALKKRKLMVPTPTPTRKVDFTLFKKDKLDILINRMKILTPTAITKKGLPFVKSRLLKTFMKDSSNYKKKL